MNEVAIITVLLGLVLLWLALGALLRAHWHIPRSFDEFHPIETDDGWTLGLYRYHPARTRGKPLLPLAKDPLDTRYRPEQNREKPPQKCPVICCHGLGTESALFELGGEESLARGLCAAGWEVWLVDLRGKGPSRPRYLDRQHGWGWTLEHHLQEDLPAIIKEVRQKSGEEQVHWVGLGLGGLLMLSRLATVGEPSLCSCVALGVERTGPSGRWWRWAGRMATFWPFVRFPLRGLLLLLFPLAPWLARWLGLYREGPQNPSLVWQVLVNATTDISTPLLRQLYRSYQQGHSLPLSLGGSPSLQQITTPLLLDGKEAATETALPAEVAKEEAAPLTEGDQRQRVETAKGEGVEEAASLAKKGAASLAEPKPDTGLRRVLVLGGGSSRGEPGGLERVVGPCLSEEVLPALLTWLEETSASVPANPTEEG